MRQPSGTSWRATAAPCTPPPTPHWSIPSKSTPRWRTRSRKPAAPRPVFSTRSDPCPAGSRTSPGSASPPDATRPKNRSPNRFPPVTLLDLDVDWGLGHEEDDENLRPAPPARARAVHRERGPRDGSASHTPPFEQREHFSVGEFQPVRRSRSVRGPPGTALRLLQVQPDLRCAVRARRLFALRAHVSVLDSAQRAAAVVRAGPTPAGARGDRRARTPVPRGALGIAVRPEQRARGRADGPRVRCVRGPPPSRRGREHHPRRSRQALSARRLAGGRFPSPPPPVRRHLHRRTRRRHRSAARGHPARRPAGAVPLVARHGGEGRPAPPLLANALPACLVRGGLAPRAPPGRRPTRAGGPGPGAPGPHGHPRVPASVLVLAARLRGPVQSRLGVPIVRGRLRGARDLVRELAAEPCAGGRDGPDAARDGGARCGCGATLGEVRPPRPLPDQGDSLPRRVVRDAVGVARYSPLDGADRYG